MTSQNPFKLRLASDHLPGDWRKPRQLDHNMDSVIYDNASYTRQDLRDRKIGDEKIAQMIESGIVVPSDNGSQGVRFFGDEVNQWLRQNRKRVRAASAKAKVASK